MNETTETEATTTVVTTRYPLLIASAEQAPVIPHGDYDYFVHPLSDGIPLVTASMLEEAAAGVVEHLDHMLPGGIASIDRFVTAEAMGLPIATAVTLATGTPFTTVRKRAYGLDGERVLDQETGYSHNKLHLNAVHAGDRVVILDDVISTGGTLRALVAGIRDARAEVAGVLSVFSKDPDLDGLARDLGCPVHALVSCQVVRGPPGSDPIRPDGVARTVTIVACDIHGHP